MVCALKGESYLISGQLPFEHSHRLSAQENPVLFQSHSDKSSAQRCLIAQHFPLVQTGCPKWP